jgi:hypothetical protein
MPFLVVTNRCYPGYFQTTSRSPLFYLQLYFLAPRLVVPGFLALAVGGAIVVPFLSATCAGATAGSEDDGDDDAGGGRSAVGTAPLACELEPGRLSWLGGPVGGGPSAGGGCPLAPEPVLGRRS